MAPQRTTELYVRQTERIFIPPIPSISMVLDFRLLSSTRIVPIVLIIFSVIIVCQAGFSINPIINTRTCQNQLISWGGGISDDKYTIVVLGSAHGLVKYDIPGSYWYWFVEFPANASEVYFVEMTSQMTGQIADSADFTIQAGADQSCVKTTSGSTSVGSTPDPGSASITPTLANSSGTSTSTVSSGSITTLTSHSSSTSLLPLPPLLSRTSTGTSSDPTGVSSPSLADTRLASSSPNVGLIAGATCGGSVVLILLLLGICLYRRRRRLAEVKAQVETKAAETTPYYPAYGSIIPRVKPYPPTNSHESSAGISQGVQPKRRTPSGTTDPLTTPDHNIAVAFATPAADNTTTSSYNPAVPPASTPSENTTSSSVTSEPIEEPPPMYQSQQIRAEEAERMRRYDALIADFCASNRDLISPALERKLHAARYLPEDDPSDVAADYWLATYGIGSLELRRLQAAYERHVPPSN